MEVFYWDNDDPNMFVGRAERTTAPTENELIETAGRTWCVVSTTRLTQTHYDAFVREVQCSQR